MDYTALIKAINAATTRLQGRAAAALNQALVVRNWLAGAWIIEFEQTGKDRAKYGTRLLETLAEDLAMKDVKGLGDPRVLRDCSALYQIYPQIRGSVTRESTGSMPLPSPTLSDDSRAGLIGALVSRATPAKTAPKSNRRSLPPESPTALEPEQVLRLSWTHLQELISIDDPWKRAFFETLGLTIPQALLITAEMVIE